ncbi:MAG TPA: DUF2069 domain-containing protein [Gammaproteobacteria bacterium]|nr:DUF2069 domain-containing protein [Gammaproteobacteria bacterium]
MTALAATGLCLFGWLGPDALRAGLIQAAILAVSIAPLAFGLDGLRRSRLRSGRWLSLVLPFYGAAFLVGAAGDAEARGWTTAGAFFSALAFASLISWVRRSGVEPRGA